jgi:L-cysteine/cystine lyase
VTDAERLRALREGLPATRSAYLNAGTFGPQPRVAIEAMRMSIAREGEHGRSGIALFEAMQTRMADARTAVAQMLACEASRIALTHSTTGGINIVLSGMQWEAGDEVVSTDAEHPGLDEPLAGLERRHGVVVRRAPAMRAVDVLDAVASLIGPRTRAVALSEVLWLNGRRLPIARIAEVARAHGAFVLVDGAQSAGAIAVDPQALGADAFALPGQKWLLGPSDTGALWLRDGVEDLLELAAPGYPARDRHADPPRIWPGARRFEPGFPSSEAIAGLLAALAFRRDEAGWEWGFDRAARMTAQCRSLLRELPGVEVVELPPEEAATLVAFSIADVDSMAAMAALEARGVRVRACPPPLPVMRASVGFWTNEDDLQRLVDGIASLTPTAA